LAAVKREIENEKQRNEKGIKAFDARYLPAVQAVFTIHH
jgi:hypothetical protein